MRVLHIASFDRWTGAAAPAFAETEALRLEGIDAHYAFVGGNNLQVRLAEHEFTHPVLERHRLLSVPRSLAALRHLIQSLRPELIHSHLTHDHILALLAAPRGVGVVRTFHAARALRLDPGTRFLARRTRALAVVNHALRYHPLLATREVEVTPPPLDTRQFHPEGGTARSQLGLPEGAPLVGYIGKVAPRRGFEEAIDTFAEIRRQIPDARLMIIGRGPHRPVLEQRIAERGLTAAVVWAGYQEAELAEHYRAADVMLFTAPGSDHGHRAIIEEIGCGTPVACYPVAGVAELLGEHGGRLMAPEPSIAALASTAVDILRNADESLSAALVQHSRRFAYSKSAERLVRLYSKALSGTS